MSDRFLSEEDLDLRNLTEAELFAWWDLWLRQAQTTNERDEHLYSHGVFRVEPPWDDLDDDDLLDPNPIEIERKRTRPAT